MTIGDDDVVDGRSAIDGINVVDGRTKLLAEGALVLEAPASDFAAPTPEPPPTPDPAPGVAAGGRGMWVWNTKDVIADDAVFVKFVTSLQAAQVSDVYLFLRASDYTAMEAELKDALGALHDAGIKPWGLEGYRGYFSDMHGPGALYKAADSLVSYNARVASDQRFAGFMSDLEPQDGADPEAPNHFHNGIADSKLTVRQAAERNALMKDWIAMHETLSRKMRGAGLKYGATMVSWVDDYYGEAVTARDKGGARGVMQHIMPFVDDYVVMAYNTDPANAANRAKGEAAYADQLAAGPRVFAAVETHKGVGAGISYGDTVAKDSQHAVFKDIDAIEAILGLYKSFAGVSIHDWVGWNGLPAD